MKHYAVCYHGTAGIGNSYGYSFVAECDEGDQVPTSDATTTVAGPYVTEAEAEMAAMEMEMRCDEFRRAQDGE